ncbi:MAG TPA: hypothetical protein PK036_14455 [Geobacteraceae bacterium]|jgi:hypothetical protein|nr:hypothetical protein [Geobacteraceae bacterium]
MTYQGTSSPKAGFVDAGVLLSFAPSVPEQKRDDTLNSILLAQLAADKRYSRFDQPDSWYEFYAKTLSNVAWQIIQSHTGHYTPLAGTFTLEEVVLDLLRENVPDEEINLVNITIKTIEVLPDDDSRVEVYGAFSHRLHVVDVQAGVLSLLESLWMAGVVFATEQDVKRLSGQEFIVSKVIGEIKTIIYNAALNEDLYAGVRDSVIEKLGRKRTELILSLTDPSSSETQPA